MIIVCNKCAARFESLIVLKERAIPELAKKILEHWHIKHNDEMLEIGTGVLKAKESFGWYITMKSLCFIPTDETILLEEMEKALDLTMTALGYDDDDTNELEDDEDTDSDSEEEEGADVEPLPNYLEADLDRVNTAKISKETGVQSKVERMPASSGAK